MQIGDLSRQAGVNVETIRYYERIGVLPKPARQANGRRSYAEADAQRLGFIRHARDLGFDLPSVAGLAGAAGGIVRGREPYCAGAACGSRKPDCPPALIAGRAGPHGGRYRQRGAYRSAA